MLAATDKLLHRGAVEWRALALAGGGLLLTFAAPPHRLDLMLIGLGALVGGVVWCPLVGPLFVGAALPFFFFPRTIAGPINVTPPGLTLAVSWLAALVRARSLALRWPKSPYEACTVLFLIAAVFSMLVTEYPLLSVRELRAVILEPLLFFWLLLALPGSSSMALTGFLAAATVTAIAAIGQEPLGVGGTLAEGVRRAQAWYPSPNHLALMLGRAWPFLVAGALQSARWLWVPALLVGLALLLTFSTGGLVGAAVAALVVLWWLGQRQMLVRYGAVAVVALVIVSGLAIAGVLPERLNPLRQTGGFRLDLWVSSIQMVRDHVVLGVGLDNFAYVYQQQYLREGAAAEPNLSHPHNWLLHMWLELGLLGVLAFGWLLVRLFQLARTRNRTWPVAGALGAMADLLVHGFIDNSYFLVDLAFVFWLTLALAQEGPGISEDASRIDST